MKEKEIPKKKHNKKRSKPRVSWIGTSLSNVLDKTKFEKDLDVEMTMHKAYCIDGEETAYFKNKTFKNVVPRVVENENTDILVLQTGSIEITDLNINEALLDTKKDLNEYKRKWFEKVEDDSKKLFKIAEEALVKNENIKKVIIVKRLPRFDRGSKDILQIKSQLSEYGNVTYDQMWQKRGSPEKIQVVHIDMNCHSSGYLKRIIFGDPASKDFDGIHLRGDGATRHFTYRAIQAVRQVMFPAKSNFCASSQSGRQARDIPPTKSGRDTDHTDCPQSQYQHRRTNSQFQYQNRQGNRQGQNSYRQTGIRNMRQMERTSNTQAADMRKGHELPTSNRFSAFNQGN